MAPVHDCLSSHESGWSVDATAPDTPADVQLITLTPTVPLISTHSTSVSEKNVRRLPRGHLTNHRLLSLAIL